MNAASLLAKEDFNMNSPTLSHRSSGYFSPFDDEFSSSAAGPDYTPSLALDSMKLSETSLNTSLLNMNGTTPNTSTPASNTQEEEFVCLECNRTFPKLVALKSHEVVHTSMIGNIHLLLTVLDEKKHQCLFCSKAFARRHDMLRHERTVHAAEKSLTCELCKKTFPDTDTLQLHCLKEGHPMPEKTMNAPSSGKTLKKSKLLKKSNSNITIPKRLSASASVGSFNTQGIPMQIPVSNNVSSGLSNIPPGVLQNHRSQQNSIFLDNSQQQPLFPGNAPQKASPWQSAPPTSGHRMSIDSSSNGSGYVAKPAQSGTITNPSTNTGVFGMQQQTTTMFMDAQKQVQQQQYTIQYQNAEYAAQFGQPQNNSGMQFNMNQMPGAVLQGGFPMPFASGATSPSQQQQQQHVFADHLKRATPPQISTSRDMRMTSPTGMNIDMSSQFGSRFSEFDDFLASNAGAMGGGGGGLLNPNANRPHDSLISPMFVRSTGIFDDRFESVVDGLVIQEEGVPESFMPITGGLLDFDP